MRELAANAAKAGETKSPAKLAARINFPATSQKRGAQPKYGLFRQFQLPLKRGYILISLVSLHSF